MPTNQSARYEAIKKIISEEMIHDQAALVEVLEKKFRITTTQVQVSRDLRKLGITKMKIGEQMAYELPESNQSREILRLAIVDVSHNETMIVVKTVPGLAPFVGDHLDSQNNIGLLGTISGENTVFVTPASTKKIKETYNKVCLALYFKKTGKKKL